MNIALLKDEVKNRCEEGEEVKMARRQIGLLGQQRVLQSRVGCRAEEQ